MADVVEIIVQDGIPGPQGPQGPQGAQGEPGMDGLSAYEIWLAEGNTGTEHDFLNSLIGPQGPQGEQGAQGIQGEKGDKGDPGNDGEQGAPGATGADGASAYEVAVDNGFIGTESQWLASLKGDPGEKGDKGDPGDDGAAGTDGKSAYQIWLDNGNTGSEQDFLDSLVGPPGTTDYNDLQNKPALGTAAEADASDFATSSQGELADTALQPADATDVAEAGKVVKYSNIGAVNTVEPQFPENAVNLAYFSANALVVGAKMRVSIISSSRLLNGNDQGLDHILGIGASVTLELPTTANEPLLDRGSVITGFTGPGVEVTIAPQSGVTVWSEDDKLKILPNYEFKLIKLDAGSDLWSLSSLGLTD